MVMATRLFRYIKRMARFYTKTVSTIVKRLLRLGKREIWIDIGTHMGEGTLAACRENPLLKVYAFEPNLQLAAKLIGVLPNFIVMPMAVAELDGCAEFYINKCDAASSLLPLNPAGVRNWIGKEALGIERKVNVPTIRLDTFMNEMGIKKVDYLEIDAQGADFSVIKSAGNRLRDIHRITLEVQIAQNPLYTRGSSKKEVVDYLEKNGFVLLKCEKQTYDQEENLTFILNAAVKGID